MRRLPPETAPKFQLTDSFGEVVRLDSGKRTLLAFFRDTNCPFCNFRIFQLTQHYKKLSDEGLEIIAFFSSTHEEVNEFVRKRPRPFTIVADPENIAYQAYGIERSMARSAYSVFRHFVSWILGIKIIGAEGLKKNLQNPSDIMPADFLIDEQGYIIETYYGSDASDHIPFENIYEFLNADQNPKKSTTPRV
jgi:peroxiredoxin